MNDRNVIICGSRYSRTFLHNIKFFCTEGFNSLSSKHKECEMSQCYYLIAFGTFFIMK